MPSPSAGVGSPRPCKCPFYGHHAAREHKLLIATDGNQCALVTRALAPCQMEVYDNAEPDLDQCEFKGSAQAIEFAMFTKSGDANQ